MNEQNLRQILGSLGIRLPRRANRRGWLEFPCPLSPWTHTNGFDRRPSAAAMIVDNGTSAFVCKACHNHGPIAKLVRLLADYRQDDSIRPLMLLADRADSEAQIDAGYPPFDEQTVDPPPEPLDDAAYGDLYPSVADHPEALEYLAGRHISPETAARLDLQFDPDQRRIIFPVRDRGGNLYGFTGRAIDPGVKLKIRDYLGLPKYYVILGEDRWTDDKPVIIVEGLFAYAHLHEIGIGEHANIGALLGSAMTAEKAERIVHADRPTYLLLDNDDGGDIGLFGTKTPSGGREDNGAVHYLEGAVPLYVPDWPDGKKDPDELTRDEVLAMLEETVPWGNDGTNNLFDTEYPPWV